jgi:hypothetical protein
MNEMRINKIQIASVICAMCLSGIAPARAQKVYSLHPLFTEKDAVLIPEIEGSWTMPVFDWTMSLRKAGDNFYYFTDDVEDSAYVHEAVFTSINDELLIDLRGKLPDDMGDADYRDSFVPCHTIYKTSISDDTLLVSSLNYSWFYHYVTNRKLPLEFEWISSGMLLTCTTEELQSFFAAHIQEDGIFHDPALITVDNDHYFGQKDATTGIVTDEPEDPYSHQCTPRFPFKDGWLGGDGDVSVAINDSTTVFIFSDTYVGNRNQTSRQGPGMGMVSNTVALQTCLPDGEIGIDYYWNNMYSDSPEPFFRSYTDRYRYWVVDAFAPGNNLYVLLAKVGPKLGAAPDDIFNFSGLGFSLAKISNPQLAPDQWNIELYPLPDFRSETMELRCHAIQDSYLYFFVSRNDTSHLLVRKQIDLMDEPDSPFEYYSLDKSWKPGIIEDDMDEIAKGFRCNSVNFHPGLKRWVMISDIRFMDNKIKMRTAPDLTGPWSDETVIYEIPEMTPGNSSHSKSNYCYLAREHIQYYDAENHVMLLTYDVNNTNYSEIVSNPNIYTPKVIAVPIKKYISRHPDEPAMSNYSH